MNGRLPWIGTVAAMLVVALVWTGVSLTHSAPAFADEEPENRLLEAMEELNNGYRQLRREARRESWSDETVATVQSMIEAAVVSMGETPPSANEVSADELDEHMVEYNKAAAELVTELMELKIAVMERRSDDIMQHLTTLLDLEESGHERFDPSY